MFIEVDLFVELPSLDQDRIELDLNLCGLYDVNADVEYRYQLKNGWVFISDCSNHTEVNDYIIDRIIQLSESYHTNYYRNVTVSCKSIET